MLDFEELYEDVIGPVNRVLYKFRDRLKADRQDLEQELFIKIFNEIDKIEDVRNQSEDWQGYVYVMCLNHLRTLEIEEHKQGLWLSNSYDEMCYLDGEYTDDRFICQHISNTGIDIKDPFLEWYYEARRISKENFKEQHPDYFKEYHKQYYKKNKDRIKEKSNQWKKDNKEYVSLYNKIHREQNKEHYKE